MTWTTFGTLTAATGGELDRNFTDVIGLGTVPGTIAGQNTLVLSVTSEVPVPPYANYQRYAGVIAQTNNAATNFQVGTYQSLPCYKDTTSGPVALSGGELQAGNIGTFIYDSALNSGAGGFHVGSAPQIGTLTKLVAGSNLSGGTITSVGTISLPLTVSSITLQGSTLSGFPTFSGTSIASTASVGTITVAAAWFGFLEVTINSTAYKVPLYE